MAQDSQPLPRPCCSAPYPAPTEIRPELLATLKVDTKGCDVWECRTCPKNAVYVLVVPVDSAWGHAVDPRCGDCYPDDLPRLCSHGWPGPTTPNRAKRRHMAERAKETEREEIVEALRRTRAALEKYGRHVGVCPADGGPLAVGRCTCGYHAALAHPVPEGVPGRV